MVSIITILATTASASGYDTKFQAQQIAVLKNSACIDIISEFRLNIWEQYGEETYPDDYAGAYIDDENNLVICYTQGKLDRLVSFYSDDMLTKATASRMSMLLSSAKEEVTKDLVTFAKKQFSYNYLFALNNKLGDYFSEFNLVTTVLNEEANTIDIYMHDLSYRSDMIDRIQKMNYSPNAVTFYETTEQPIATKNAYAGDKIWYNYGFLGLSTSSGTIGFNARYNGVNGVVTNGHVAEAGKTMKVAGGTLGKPTFSNYSNNGKVDVAFVPFPDQSWATSNLIKNDGYTRPVSYGGPAYSYLSGSASITQGANTYKYGITTGKSFGKITSTSININCDYGDNDVRLIKDCFGYSNSSQKGDSGGPVGIYSLGSWGESRVSLTGINFAGVGTGYGIKLSNILNQYPGLTPIY